MAKLETTVRENFSSLVKRIEDGILNGSISATLEESSDFSCGGARCSVRAFERYSYFGGNRVSLTVTFFDCGDGLVRISAISTGGSQAMFFKMNTFGEESFLAKFEELL